MSSTIPNTATATSSAAAATTSAVLGQGQSSQGISLVALLTAMASSLIIFGVQMLLFILLKNKLARIFQPKTYLVPEKERTEPPPRTPWGWLVAIFHFTDREIINKCGLDAYFFLRYLQTLLIIFVPLALVILPILIPVNKIGGRGSNWIALSQNQTTTATTTGTATTTTSALFAAQTAVNVTGMDVLAWGNVKPSNTERYWAHLVLAILVIFWVCGVFFAELRVYIKVRQDWLTSAEHRLRASATTVLVSAIPEKWLTYEALAGLYDVFPGGIRNIWINRNFDELLTKISYRDQIFKDLESAETELIRKAKKAQMKQLKKDKKKASKGTKSRKATKEEEAQEVARADAEAERLAASGGIAEEDPNAIPHTVDDAINEQEHREQKLEEHEHHHRGSGGFKLADMGNGLRVVGQGFGAIAHGVQDVGKGFTAAGDTVVGGFGKAGRDLDDQIETTNGFVNLNRQSVAEFDKYGRYIEPVKPKGGPYGSGVQGDMEKNRESPDLQQYGAAVSPSVSADDPRLSISVPKSRMLGNTVRRSTQVHDWHAPDDEGTNWWKFWLGPAGGFPSPVPTGMESDEFPLTKSSAEMQRAQNEKPKGLLQTIKNFFSSGGQDVTPIEYPIAHNKDYREDEISATWEKYLKHKDRPTMRVHNQGWNSWMPRLPFLNKKVDTIYYCRGELARLNLEIEEDQQHPERFPLMNSAFIQFNHQVAAHMASQSVAHHVPKHMAPRSVEISPKDVIWSNMSVTWWQAWIKTGSVFTIVTGMVVLWIFPVAWTATLAQITTLSSQYSWLSWLDKINQDVLKALAGVLPAAVLALLLWLVPNILHFLALVQGAQTGTQLERTVQNYYFAFLFVQVFLVVSVSTGAITTLASSVSNLTSIPDLLATNLPKAANYFFSYMILQALSTSSGTLLQIGTLIMWFILPKLFDNTARQKWRRNTTLPSVQWGSFFPIYTNFACIALVYSVVAPVIIVFAIITFGLLWIAMRYSMLYVIRFELDTGGLLYPRAINQTFTGLYIMEICLIGLFFIVRDQNNNTACVPQAIIMIVAMVFTAIYQVLLNMSFGPLFHHLPITFEDEAVLRDEAFERAQARRLGLVEGDDDETTGLTQGKNDIELTKLAVPEQHNKLAMLNPINIATGAGTWAAKSGKHIREKTFGRGEGDATNHSSPHPRRRHVHKDVEAQKKITDALYGGYNDEIEDLTPDERDVLVKDAFRHIALRTRRPILWIPRDDLGVSDDEIKRTREFGNGNIWISNVGTALDGQQRVVYGRNPPDFSEVDLINL
ncbi:hypothetical protein BP5796_10711 [Coleophoma crateriformis]|uniref:DUF221-domain-containing protein n=1 Tax=Coleophoma crateriformis TaxID=565419 RepID=A0A3D8QQX4_9HELO|nr:hypothetical protein BP5796_10711 [Coleophoma crateriformis]